MTALLCVAGCGSPGQGDPVGTKAGSVRELAATALVGATIIDGTGGSAIANGVVLVRGQQIAAVGPQGSLEIPDGTRVIDVSGRWIIPGLIDSHVHFFETGRIYTKPAELDLTHEVSYDDEIRWMKARVPVTLARYLCAGVTSAVSMGGPHFEFEVRDAARQSSRAPNVFESYGPITAARLGHDIFPPIDGDEATRVVADADAAVAEVRRGIEWGADLIKTGYLGGPFASQETGFFGMLPAIVAEAHAHHIPVSVHATEVEPARQAMLAGADSLAHLPTDAVVDDDFVKLALERGVEVITTIAVWTRDVEARSGKVSLTPIESSCGDPEVIASWSAGDDRPPVAEEQVEAARQEQKIAMENARRLHDAGVPLAVGVDPGNLGLLHGPSAHKEMELLAEAGIPPADIIVEATRNAARVAGVEDDIGTLEPGKLADLVVLSADPMLDIRNASKIEQVMKSGSLFEEIELLP